MRTIAALAALRSLAGRCSHTRRLITVGMLGPPCHVNSLEDSNQLFNGSCSENGGLWAWFWRTRGARDGNVTDLAGDKLNLAVPDVARQTGKSKKFQHLAKEWMTGIRDRDLTFAQFGDQRCITLAGVFPFQSDRSERRSHSAG